MNQKKKKKKGTILDRIDYNIEQVVTHTHQAAEELVQGEKYQKSSRNKMCILLLIVVVVALVLFLVARPRKSSTPTAAPTEAPTNPPTDPPTFMFI